MSTTKTQTEAQAPGVTSTVLRINPEIARVMLADNPSNRTLRPTLVAEFAKDMKAGKWRMNGETIKVDPSGNLIDGQHRLAAVIEAGVPVLMLVVQGLPFDVQDTVDTGAKRTFADVLRLRGESRYTTLATIVRSVHGWEAGHRMSIRDGMKNVSVASLTDTLNANPGIRDVVSTADRSRNHVHLPTSIGGLAAFLFSRINQEDADWFFERLINGDALEEDDPIFVLRRILLASYAARTTTANRHPGYNLALVIKTWNKYRSGEKTTQLSFRMGGARPEAFPEPI